MKAVCKGEEAFRFDIDSFTFIATYLEEPKRDALIEIERDGKRVKAFLWPAYKIWNISAHADDIVAGLLEGNDSGLYVAGSDGLGGNSYGGEKA